MQTLVFDPKTLEALGLQYKDGKVRSLNKRGYMRNVLCDISREFCSQPLGEADRVLEIGSGIGCVIKQLVEESASRITGVDMEPKHLDIISKLVEPTLSAHPGCRLDLVCDSLPRLSTLPDGSFQSILCAQVLHYMEPAEFTQALTRLHGLLRRGGNLFITVGSPFNASYPGFAEEYEKRLARGDAFPGFMEDTRKYHPNGAQHNFGKFLFFGPKDLSARVSGAGFAVTRAEIIEDVDGWKQTGLCATRL